MVKSSSESYYVMWEEMHISSILNHSNYTSMTINVLQWHLLVILGSGLKWYILTFSWKTLWQCLKFLESRGQWLNLTSVLFFFLAIDFYLMVTNIFNMLPNNVGCFEIISLWETTETKNHDENAWAWRWALLDDFLPLLSFCIFDLHVGFCSIWCTSR